MFVKIAIVIGSFLFKWTRQNEDMWAFPEKRTWPKELIKKTETQSKKEFKKWQKNKIQSEVNDK